MWPGFEKLFFCLKIKIKKTTRVWEKQKLSAKCFWMLKLLNYLLVPTVFNLVTMSIVDSKCLYCHAFVIACCPIHLITVIILQKQLLLRTTICQPIKRVYHNYLARCRMQNSKKCLAATCLTLLICETLSLIFWLLSAFTGPFHYYLFGLWLVFSVFL